jgi:hypothetical protein
MTEEKSSSICSGHQDLRDIVIETRTVVLDIRNCIKRLEECGESQEGRIRYLEINGAGVSQQNAKDIEAVDGRVKILEKSLTSGDAVDEAKQKWYDSVWAKVLGVAGFAIGLIALLKEIFK